MDNAGLGAIRLDEGTGILRADTPEEFAEFMLRLHSDQQLREVVVGRRHIELEARRHQIKEVLERLCRMNANPPSCSHKLRWKRDAPTATRISLPVI